MDESAPLRRSTRKSVVTKTDDVTLTPKKRGVVTPIKIEHGTPSRRITRASSGTPKKSLAEPVSTPKKNLPVLKESDEDIPKKRIALKLNENNGTPKKNVNDKLSGNGNASPPTENVVDSKKINDKPEDIVVEGRPLTRAKRKTLTEKKVTEIQNVNAETDKNSHIKKIKQITQSDPKQEVVSCNALVPKIAPIEMLNDYPKEVNIAKKSGKNYDCSEAEIKYSYKSKSPLKADEISTTTPSKFPENYKSTSENTLLSKYSKTEIIEMSPVGCDDSTPSPKKCGGSARKYLEFESKSPSKPDEEAAKSPVSGTIINTGTPDKLLNSENVDSTLTSTEISNNRTLITTESQVSEYISSVKLETETVTSENPLPYKDIKINVSEESITATTIAKDIAGTKDDVSSLESVASIIKSSVIKDSTVDLSGSPTNTKKEHVAQSQTNTICENPSTPEDNNKDVNESEASITKTSLNNNSDDDSTSSTKDKDVTQLEPKNENPSQSLSEDNNKVMNKSEASVTKSSPNKDSAVDLRGSPTKTFCENPSIPEDNNKNVNESEASITKTSLNNNSDDDSTSSTKDKDVTQLEPKNENPSQSLSEDNNKVMNKSEASVTKSSPNKDSAVDLRGSPTKTFCENPSIPEDNNKNVNESEASITRTSLNNGGVELARSSTKDEDVTQIEPKNENPSPSLSEDNNKVMNKSEASVTKSSPNKESDVDCKGSAFKTDAIEQSIETKNICENPTTPKDNNKCINEVDSSITKSSPNKDCDVVLKRNPNKDEDVKKLESENENPLSSEDNNKFNHTSEASLTKTSPNKDKYVDCEESPFKTKDVEHSPEITLSLETKNIFENPSLPDDYNKDINEVESSISKTSGFDLEKSLTKDEKAVEVESKNENQSSSEDVRDMNTSVTKTSPNKNKDVVCNISTIKTEDVEQGVEDTVSDNHKGNNVSKHSFEGHKEISTQIAFVKSQTKSKDGSSLRKRRFIEDRKELTTENSLRINNNKDDPEIHNKSDLSIIKTCFEDSKNNKDDLIESQLKPENKSSPNKKQRLGDEMTSVQLSNNESSKKNQTVYKISPSKKKILDILDNITLFPDIEGNTGTDSDNSELVIDEDAGSQKLKDNLDFNKQGGVLAVTSTKADVGSPAKLEIFSAQSVAVSDQKSTKRNESMLTSTTDDKSPSKQKQNINIISTVDVSMKNNVQPSNKKNIEEICKESRSGTISNTTTVEENLIILPHKAKVLAEADGHKSKDMLDELLMSPKDFLNSDEESVICDDKSADTNVEIQRNILSGLDVTVADNVEIDDCEKKYSITEGGDTCKQNENSPKTSVSGEDCYVIDESDSLFMRDLIKKKCEGTFPKPSSHDNKSSDLEVEMGNSFDEKSTCNVGSDETSPVTSDLEKPKTFAATVKSNEKTAFPKGSESDDSEISKSNDVSGKDFINFEAEEGEESSDIDYIKNEGEESSDIDYIKNEEGEESSDIDYIKNEEGEESSDIDYIKNEEGEESSDIDYIKNEGEVSPVHNDASGKDFINYEEGEESSVYDDVSGKDFINFEAEEGEESFVDDIDSADASNSSKKKRKMSFIIVSSDSDHEDPIAVISSCDEEAVSSKSFPSKSKKQKLGKREKKSNVKESVTHKRQTNNRIKEKKIIEVTKTAIFVVSSIDKDLEKSKSSKNLRNKKQSYAVPRGFTVTEINSKSDRGTKKLNRKIKKEIASPFEVILVLPSETNSKTIMKALKKMGIHNILSLSFVNPKVATLLLSTRESFKKVLNLYGKLMINDQPVYTLEPSSF